MFELIFQTSLNMIMNFFSLKSDHAMISSIYSHKDIKIQPKFHKFFEQKPINKQDLTEQFNNCRALDEIFLSNYSNFVASTIVSEVSNIIDSLSPLNSSNITIILYFGSIGITYYFLLESGFIVISL